MRIRSLAAIVALCSACTNGRALRVGAERHSPIVPRHETRRPEPSVGLMLANPLYCLAPLAGGAGGGGPLDSVVLLVMAGCGAVVGAVDVVALPVQAVRRSHAWRDLESLERSCPLQDPATRIAVHLAGRMAGEFGFTPVPSAPLAEPVAAGGAFPRDAVIVRVRTTHFARSSEVSWEGEVEFCSANDEPLWRWGCADRTPRRAAATSGDECEVTRRELADLADRCIERAVENVRANWSRWDQRRDGGATGAGREAMIDR